MNAAAVETLERIWAGGGKAHDAAPPDWREAIGEETGDEGELRLLALVSQAARVTLRSAPVDAPTRPDLPKLSLPTLPEPVRAAFRATVAPNAAAPLLAVELLAARGWSAHPLDWMPGARGEAPALYRPWVEWQAGNAEAPEVLDEETWDEVTRAPRRMMLHDLRLADPDAARAVMEAKLASRPAEERVELVEVMRTGLSEADADFLHSLASDRSGKVKEEAARLLARLQRADDGSADAALIREVIGVETVGLLRRKRVFRPKRRPRSGGARHEDIEALSGVTLSSLAVALGTTNEAFIAGWNWNDNVMIDGQIATIVANSATDEEVQSFAETCVEAGEPSHHTLAVLASRLTAGGWSRLVNRILASASDVQGSLVATLSEVPSEARALGTVPARKIAGSALLPWLVEREGKRERYDYFMPDALAFLGLVADREGAAFALDAMRKAGRPLADPDLALLRLNATLPHAS